MARTMHPNIALSTVPAFDPDEKMVLLSRAVEGLSGEFTALK